MQTFTRQCVYIGMENVQKYVFTNRGLQTGATYLHGLTNSRLKLAALMERFLTRVSHQKKGSVARDDNQCFLKFSSVATYP